MSTITQISGNIHPDNRALHTLQGVFAQLNIRVTHPSADELFFYNRKDPDTTWQRYDNELSLYKSISNSPFHIIFNDGKIDQNVGRQILYAMTKKRPILMTGAPVFASSVTPFTRDLIKAHVWQFHSINLPELEASEMKLLISKLIPKDYKLSENEKVLIHSQTKAHFRRLLEDAREIYVAN